MKLGLPAVLCLGVSGTAQVFPGSLTSVEGNTGYAEPFGHAKLRYQQIHGDVQKLPAEIRSIAWRRNATAPPAVATPWWSDFVLRMAASDFERVSEDLASNYKSPPVVVSHQQRFVLPDWKQPAPGPMAFDFVVPLDAPYVRVPDKALLWEVEVAASASPETPLPAADGFEASADFVQWGSLVGQGCGLQLRGYIATLHFGNRFNPWITESPGTAYKRVIVFGSSDPNLTVSGWCAPLRVEPLLVVVSQGGNYGFYFPYEPGLVGQILRAQMLFLFETPMRISNGLELVVPAFPQLGDRSVTRVTSPLWPWETAVVRRGQGLVVRLQ